MILLHQFDKTELKELGLWVNSPIHNSSKKIVKLFECIKKRRKNASPLNEYVLLKSMGVIPSASKKTAISERNRKELQQALHLLYLQAQDFIVWKSIKRDNIQAKRRIMDTYLEKKVYSLIPSLLNKAKRELESASVWNIKYHEDLFALSEIEFYLTILLGNRKTDTELQNVIEKLRQSFFSSSLKYYCSMVNYEKILKVKFDYPFLTQIKTHLANSPDQQLPIIRVYYSLLKLLEEEQREDYYTLKNYLFEHLDNFGITDIRQFFNFMTNHCIWKLRNGEKEFLRERFEIYQKGILLQCWTAGTYFSEHQFVNIIKTAITLKELDWAQSFFDAHTDLLNPDVKDIFIHYYHALYAFELKDYQKTQEFLGRIQTNEDFTYYLQFKILYIKLFYDKRDLNPQNAETHIVNYEADALRQYLLKGNNRKMAEPIRLLYSNFTNFFLRILRRKKKILFQKSLTKANLVVLQNDLHNLKPVVERLWLEEKIAELMLEVN